MPPQPDLVAIQTFTLLARVGVRDTTGPLGGTEVFTHVDGHGLGSSHAAGYMADWAGMPVVKQPVCTWEGAFHGIIDNNRKTLQVSKTKM